MKRRIIAVRHAEAAEAGGRFTDRLRPLTRKGRREFMEALEGYIRMGADKHGLVLTSPLVRAWQTSEMLAERIGLQVRYCEALAPGAPLAAILNSVREAREESGPVYLVGHNPSISDFVSRCIGARADSIRMKKGAMARIDFDARWAFGGGRLAWLLQPGQLRGVPSTDE
jgi:phosphohistidine phosphatase